MIWLQSLTACHEKKRGGKAFKRAQTHRTNYINWAINQLNLTGVGELRLEKLHQMRRGVNMGSHLGHWTYTAINEQIISRCEQLGSELSSNQLLTDHNDAMFACGHKNPTGRERSLCVVAVEQFTTRT
jgi:hypothetical protein